MPRYRYLGPEGIGAGKFTTPLLGEVEIGEEYDVAAKDAHAFEGHPEFKLVRKSKSDESGDDAGKEA